MCIRECTCTVSATRELCRSDDIVLCQDQEFRPIFTRGQHECQDQRSGLVVWYNQKSSKNSGMSRLFLFSPVVWQLLSVPWRSFCDYWPFLDPPSRRHTKTCTVIVQGQPVVLLVFRPRHGKNVRRRDSPNLTRWPPWTTKMLSVKKPTFRTDQK